jgi:hypothetical protein
MRQASSRGVVQLDVRQALACRSFGDKLKFLGHLFQLPALFVAGTMLNL